MLGDVQTAGAVLAAAMKNGGRLSRATDDGRPWEALQDEGVKDAFLALCAGAKIDVVMGQRAVNLVPTPSGEWCSDGDVRRKARENLFSGMDATGEGRYRRIVQAFATMFALWLLVRQDEPNQFVENARMVEELDRAFAPERFPSNDDGTQSDLQKACVVWRQMEEGEDKVARGVAGTWTKFGCVQRAQRYLRVMGLLQEGDVRTFRPTARLTELASYLLVDSRMEEFEDLIESTRAIGTGVHDA